MMEATIKFEMGERTCAVVYGDFCRFFATTRFGTVPFCSLFNGPALYEKNGWVQRCKECLDEFGTTKEPV